MRIDVSNVIISWIDQTSIMGRSFIESVMGNFEKATNLNLYFSLSINYVVFAYF